MPRSIVLIEISPCYSAVTAWGTEKRGAGQGGAGELGLTYRGGDTLGCLKAASQRLGWFLLKCDVNVAHGDQPVSGIQENSIFREERAADKLQCHLSVLRERLGPPQTSPQPYPLWDRISNAHLRKVRMQML